MRYNACVEKTFSAAHALRGYKGKCERLHGHTWKVRAYVSGEQLNKLGMLVDFHDLKAWLGLAVSELDHAYINKEKHFVKINPTAENIAAYIFGNMKKRLAEFIKNGGALEYVEVWESESSSARVTE